MNRLSGLKWLLGIGLVLALPATATHVACSTLSGSSLQTIISGDGGCSTTDYRFSNFTVDTSGAGDTINGILVPSSGFTNTVLSSQIFLSLSVNDPDLIALYSPGPDAGAPTTNNCDQNGGTGGWCVQGQTQLIVSTVTYSMEAVSGNIPFVGFEGSVISHTSGGADAAAIVFLEICAGPNAPTVWGAGNDCAAQNGGTGVYSVLQGGGVQGNFNTLDFSLANMVDVPKVWLRETVYLTTDKGNGSWATVLPVELLDTPEPATFSMIGAGLMALALIARRRRVRLPQP